jgi:hypothetical protein
MGTRACAGAVARGVRTAARVYDGEARARDEEVLGETMAPFVAMVRQHPSLVDARCGRTAQMEWLLNVPRWKGAAKRRPQFPGPGIHHSATLTRRRRG